MATRHYTVRFLTPAFLGNAHQDAQWRTPPFKHLLREWWRVVYAADHGFDANKDFIRKMRREEGLLFGHAWLEDDAYEQNGRLVKTAARKSLVRMRLDRWDEGMLKAWSALPSVKHPEVKFPVGSDLYMAYGPLLLPRGARQPTLKANAAIQSGEFAGLDIAYPTTHAREELRRMVEANAPRIEHALWLMDRYGALGGRSRNGWGSLALEPANDAATLAGNVPLRDWRDCLDRDWPHAIGRDENGALIWQTEPHDDWKSLMKSLAELKIGLRTQFRFTSGRNAPAPESRHWLSYPVTNHSVRDWGRNARLPNSLRFKARPTEAGGLVGILYHMPCLPPPSFDPDGRAIQAVWKQVHKYLDAHLKRGEA